MIFPFVELAVLLLKLVNGILASAEKQRLINEGRRQVIVEELAKITKRLEIAAEVRAEVERLTAEEVDQRLREAGDFRRDDDV